MKSKELLLSVSIFSLMVPASAFAAGLPLGQESWTGMVERKNADEVRLVVGAKTYEITGPQEAELVDQIDKNVIVKGTMEDVDGRESIEVASFEPVTEKTMRE